MAIYKCSICGAIFDEEKEGKKFSELDCCPVCKQPPSKFEKISEDEDAKTAVRQDQSELAYDSGYERSDPNSRYMDEIHEMAVTGKSIDGAMGTRMAMPGWDDILILGAQLNPPPLLDSDPVETKTVIGKHAKQPSAFTGNQNGAGKRKRNGKDGCVQRRRRHSSGRKSSRL